MKIWNKKYINDFQQYETVRSFGESIYTSKVNIDEAEMDQRNILKNIVEFDNKSRSNSWIWKIVKHLILRLLLNLTEKVNLKRTDRYFALSNTYTLHRKYKKVI